MKKIIFILVILAVLLFSGCDAMLEVFYPELKEDFSDSNNIFDIEYQIGDYHRGVMDTAGQPIMMSIYEQGFDPYNEDEPLDTIYFYDDYGLWTFFVDNMNYDVWIWCNVDGSENLLGTPTVTTDDFITMDPIVITGTIKQDHAFVDPSLFETVVFF